jgi:hypothetical protein
MTDETYYYNFSIDHGAGVLNKFEPLDIEDMDERKSNRDTAEGLIGRLGELHFGARNGCSFNPLHGGRNNIIFEAGFFRDKFQKNFVGLSRERKLLEASNVDDKGSLVSNFLSETFFCSNHSRSDYCDCDFFSHLLLKQPMKKSAYQHFVYNRLRFCNQGFDISSPMDCDKFMINLTASCWPEIRKHCSTFYAQPHVLSILRTVHKYYGSVEANFYFCVMEALNDRSCKWFESFGLTNYTGSSSSVQSTQKITHSLKFQFLLDSVHATDDLMMFNFQKTQDWAETHKTLTARQKFMMETDLPKSVLKIIFDYDGLHDSYLRQCEANEVMKPQWMTSYY